MNGILAGQFVRALALSRLALNFGQVARATLHPDGTPESDTTHSYMLALLALDLAPPELDRGRLLLFALVHDVPEVYAGDTNTARTLGPAEKAAKAAREAEAIERIKHEFALSPWLSEALGAYERQDTLEASFIRYLDKILPKLTHLQNDFLALRALGMTPEEMVEKHAHQAEELHQQYPYHPELRDLLRVVCTACEVRYDAR